MISTNDLLVVGFLVILEGLLSFDNALALAAMVSHLPEAQRKRALTYGMAGAFVFRLVALGFVTTIMENPWIKLAGGAYLLFLTVKHFWFDQESAESSSMAGSYTFWKTIVLVELTDIAFSIDSILAAVAVSNKLWVIVMGGIMGIITMRFVANVFVDLIKRYPNLVRSAYILVGLIGGKLVLEGFNVASFEHGLLSYVLWASMLAALGSGFYERKQQAV